MSVARLVRWSVLFAAFTVAGSGFSADVAAGPIWACWYEPNDVSIRCRVVRVPTSGLDERAAEVERTFHPRLPEALRRIWGAPESLAINVVTIPLGNVPYDMDFVRQLAESVMCGRRKDCSVQFDVNLDEKAPLRAAALKREIDQIAAMTKVIPREPVLARAEVAGE